MMSWKKLLLSAAILLSVPCAVSAGQAVNIQNGGWDCCVLPPVKETSGMDKSKCVEPPANAKWQKNVSIGAHIPRKGIIDHLKSPFNTWYRRNYMFPVPALDKVTICEINDKDFDPYMYIYW